MLRLRYLLLAVLCTASSPAAAGLFADEDARKQAQQLEERTVKLEAAIKLAEDNRELLVRSMLDLQMQVEMLNGEIRKLRGQNEELLHSLQDAEKRQKDFYIDLDARLRRLEAGGAGAAVAVERPVVAKGAVVDPAGESGAFEKAYNFYKAENYAEATLAFGDFLKNYPQSEHEANVHYWLGNAYFLLKDCTNSVGSYQALIGKFPDHPRLQEALFNVADCQLDMKNKNAAKKTLKQVIAKFPGSDASQKAKKRLAAIK